MCGYFVLNKYVHSQFSHRFPDVPAGHLHCPVTLSHGAPVQLHGWTQPVPNLPSGQSDPGHAGDICVNTGGQKLKEKFALKDEEYVGPTYPDHSCLHDDREGIFVGTLQSHDHTILLVDRRTSSHSRLRRYLGCILEIEQDGFCLCLEEICCCSADSCSTFVKIWSHFTEWTWLQFSVR